MAVFAWRGINASGKEVKGLDDADNPKALRLLLKRQGVLVTQVEEEAAKKKREARNVDFKRLLSRVSLTDLALTTRQMATLLRSRRSTR
jgi:general secretion pathway protein F